MKINIRITQWLKEESEAILDMLDSDQLDAANYKIVTARLDVQQTCREIVNTLT